MKYSLTMVNESVHHVAGGDVPDADGRVRGTGNDHALVILQAKDGPGVAVEHLRAGKGVAVPHLDGVVAQPRDDLGLVVLEAVDTLGVLRTAVDSLQVVLATPPVVLDRVNVLDDGRIELAVETVIWVRLAGLRLEQALDPTSAIGEAAPQCVGMHFTFDKLLPQHSLRNDSQPRSKGEKRIKLNGVSKTENRSTYRHTSSAAQRLLASRKPKMASAT